MSMLTVIDLFAGAGGFGLGFKKAGYAVSLSLEIDQWACDTLRHNHADMCVIQDDIKRFNSDHEINAVVESKPDVIIGGPPCQGFSISGPANKDPKDPRNALFVDFARWVEILQPRVFVMENVKGLLSRHNAKGEKVIGIIENTFHKIGYKTNVWVLNAAHYGVPQIRERVFVVGSVDRVIPPPSPSHSLTSDSNPMMFPEHVRLPMITLWEAISDLPSLEAGEGEEIRPYNDSPHNDYQSQMRAEADVLCNHVAMKHTKRMVERFKQIQWGQSASDVTGIYAPRQRGNNQLVSTKVYDQNNRRLHPHQPSHTITASFYANFVHPYQHRNLTAREGARVQSFPDDYCFLGKPTIVSNKLLNREGRLDEAYLCQYNQVGNAVPPLLAEAIAKHLRKEYFRC